MNSNPACPSCGAAIGGGFCAQCGEQRLRSLDFSCRHYFEQAVDVLTHYDSKILRSVWLLVSRPGALSADYLRGRRVHFMNPLRLFVLISVVYFISLTVLHAVRFPVPPAIQFNTFATPLAIQLHGNDFYAGFAERQVARKMQRNNISFAALERRYDGKTTTFSKTLLFALIPVIALLLAALFLRKRRFLSEHLVIATHFWAFALLLIGILVPAVLAPVIYLAGSIGWSTGSFLSDRNVSCMLQLVFAVYLFLMLRRAYSASVWYSALVALSIAWSFFFIVWLFRFFLFVVTLRAI